MLNRTGRDWLADLDVLATAAAVRAALEANGHRARTVNICEEGFGGLRAFDAVFNLGETVAGCELTETAIVGRLEQMEIPYFGADAEALARCADKARAKSILISHGLPTPRYQVFRDATDLRTVLGYPLIVKPMHEHGSIGISDDAVAQDDAALARRVIEVLRVYNQPALVEEYIDGREISAAVIGDSDNPRVFPLVETLFTVPPGSPRIVSYTAKWVPGSSAGQFVQPGCPADLDPELGAEIKAMAARVCQVLGCRDYTRIDFRLRGRTPYVLEANPNPCINPLGSSFVASAEDAGFTYEAIINEIVEAALSRLPALVQSMGLYA